MLSVALAISSLLTGSAVAADDVCGESPQMVGKYVHTSISVPGLGSAAECCQRCLTTGNECTAWVWDSDAKTCGFTTSFNASDIMVDESGKKVLGQLREMFSIYNPEPIPPPSGARNVLFIVADDMRPSLPMYGLSEGYAPNLERLANEGTLWRHAYVQYSYCAPSRNSFMSGRRPDATKAYSFEDTFREYGVGSSWLSLPQAFKANGYFVAGSGKLFHPGIPANFDLPYSWSTDTYSNGKNNVVNECKEVCCGVPDEEKGIWCAYDVKNGTKLQDMDVKDNVIALLEEGASRYKNGNQPFFVGMGIHKPHLTWQFPKEFLDKIPETVPTARYDAWPNNIPHLHWHECAEMSVHGIFVKDYETNETWGVPPPSKKVQSDERRGYYACIAYVDSLIGEALDKLDSLGVADDTIVLFMADHGWSVYEADVTCKMTPDERGTRIPFIIKDPAIKQSKGQVAMSVAEAVDVMPTLFDLALGKPLEGKGTENLGGVSLRPVLEGGDSKAPKYVALTQFSRCWQNMSSDGYDTDKPGDERNRTASFDSMSDCHWVHRNAIDFMGYSIRTTGEELGDWRYTEWVVWDGPNLKPDWSQVVGRELYNHTGDDGLIWVYDDFVVGEYLNLADTLPDQAATLSKLLRTEVGKWIVPGPKPAPFAKKNSSNWLSGL